jgi:lipopolysaccharide transport system ATP-binding protein
MRVIMDEETVISLKNVSKGFNRYETPVDRLKEIVFPGRTEKTTFWALQNVSLDILKGQTVGIVGRNGSGKSTLLQIIAGTLTPTKGDVLVNGRVSALLELGSGFNPEFTGRQNVFFNGRLLGLSQEQISSKFNDIAAFAELDDFLDEPVKSYSSGMLVRLAFSVVAHTEPSVLIIDEALAVGDIFFQKKCYEFLESLKTNGTSILFVSHDTQAILKLCDRALILQNGKFSHDGQPIEIMNKYLELYFSQLPASTESVDQKKDEHTAVAVKVNKNQEKCLIEGESIDLVSDPPHLFINTELYTNKFADSAHRYGKFIGMIEGVAITDGNGKAKIVFQCREKIAISIRVNSQDFDLGLLSVGFQLVDRFGQIIIGTNTCMMNPSFELYSGSYFDCQFCFCLSIAPQSYVLNIAVSENSRSPSIIYDWINGAFVLDVISTTELSQAGVCFANIEITRNQLL